jgi:hypothetical protein
MLTMRLFMPLAVVLAALLLAGTMAWIGRYETTAASGPDGPSVFITDRWSGTTKQCAVGAGGSLCVSIYPSTYSLPTRR